MTVKETKQLPLKPYMPGELANFYEVSGKTFSSWIKPLEEKLGKREGRYFNIKQVQIIFEALGIPQVVKF